ncbi:MAG: hypothetical protein CMJ25_22305 [Phycisphaerae bacterium]|nr:hypothetical protein [Phycisphaerae bacterium]|tara:strand:+ start:1153 stop:2253 length:1101 start_codon:yes stop_codon:yes gene_type:complete
MTKAAELAKMGEVLTNSQIGGRRNIVINGGMICSQRATSATGLGDGTVGYVALDRFRLEHAGSPTARYTMTQDSNAPEGFANSMKLEVTTADTSFASDDHQYIDQFIEAQNLQQLAYGTASAERITLSFYVKCSTAQTFALDLVNEDNSRYFNTTYTVSSADTWERKIITFPADTASGFNNDNGRGLRVRWTLVAGSDLTDGSVSTAWSGTQHIATNHENTWVGATSRTWQLTGVQLEVGSQATPFEHLSFGETLALAQRYYTLIASGDAKTLANMQQYSATILYGVYPLPVEMRAVATLEQVTGTNYYIHFRNGTGDSFNELESDTSTARAIELHVDGAISGTAGHAGWIRTTNASAHVAVSAEL